MPAAVPTTGVFAVVVTYHPDLERLLEGLHEILLQVDEVIVVDNGSSPSLAERISALDRVSVIALKSNQGIACAQNRGIERAKIGQAEFVLLLDQDSVAAPDMVARLRRAYAELSAQGERVGVVGPAQVDGLGGSVPRFTRFQRGRYLAVNAVPGCATIPCDVLIASGMLMPMAALDEVGLMRENLFIDKVDTEWCLRAHRLGFSIHGVPGASLHHRLGESVLTVKWRKGKRYPVHKPFRYYYMVRNSILLQRSRGIRWAWRLADLPQMLLIILLYGVFSEGSFQNRKMIVRGLRDGLANISGPMPSR